MPRRWPRAYMARYMFFAERQCQKIGLKATARALDRCGVLGAGLMGGGIAMCCAEAGMQAGEGYRVELQGGNCYNNSYNLYIFKYVICKIYVK